MPVEADFNKVPDLSGTKEGARDRFYATNGFDPEDYLAAVRKANSVKSERPTNNRDEKQGALARLRWNHGYNFD